MRQDTLSIACVVISWGISEELWETLEALERAEKPEGADWFAVISYNEEVIELLESSTIYFDEIFVGKGDHLTFAEEFEDVYDEVLIFVEGEDFEKVKEKLNAFYYRSAAELREGSSYV